MGRRNKIWFVSSIIWSKRISSDFRVRQTTTSWQFRRCHSQSSFQRWISFTKLYEKDVFIISLATKLAEDHPDEQQSRVAQLKLAMVLYLTKYLG